MQTNRMPIPAFSKKIEGYNHRRNLTEEEIADKEAAIIQASKDLKKVNEEKKEANATFTKKIKSAQDLIDNTLASLHLGFVEEEVDAFEVRDRERRLVFVVDQEGNVLHERAMTTMEYQTLITDDL